MKQKRILTFFERRSAFVIGLVLLIGAGITAASWATSDNLPKYRQTYRNIGNKRTLKGPFCGLLLQKNHV